MTNDNQHIPSGYKPSPLGPIPEDWEVKRLGEICTHFKSGITITSKDIHEDGLYPVYGGNGLRGYANTFTHDGSYILIGRQGALCGNVNYVDGKNYISEHAIAVQTNENVQWLKYKLENWNLNRFSESSAQPGLSVEKLVRYKLSVPTLKEQNKIADILSLWDTAIAKQTTLIEKLTLRKRGLMQQLLTGKKRLKGFEEEWKEIKLGEILRESTVAATESKVEKRITVRLNLQGIEQREVRGTEEKDATMYFVRKQGQFIYGKQNLHKGAFGIIPKELDGYESSSDIPAFDFIGNVIPKYFYYYMCLIYGSLESIATGTGSKRIQPKNLLKKSYLFPALNEQQILSDIFNHLDYEIKLHNNKLSSLQSQKRGLMQQLLTGRKRIIG